MNDQDRERRLAEHPLANELSTSELPQHDDKSKNDEKPKNARTATTHDLQDIFGFSDAELNANRMGRFSNEQREKLDANLKEEVDGMWLILTIMLGTAALIGLIVFPAGDRTVPMIVAIGGVIAAFMAFSYRRQTQARNMMDSQRVKQIAGVPQLSMARWRTGEGSLTVGDRRLSISSEQLIKLASMHLPYMKVYYTQNGERVISAEVMTTYNDDLRDDGSTAEDIVIIPDDFSDQLSAKQR